MKGIFVVFVIFLAVASAQISTLFSYRGTGCDDDTKFVSAQVTFVFGCANKSCEYYADSDTYVIKRCYYNISDAPIPEDVVSVAFWAVSDCKGLDSVTYQRTGEAGCLANGDFSSSFTCGTLSVCNHTDCTACTSSEFIDGECTPAGQIFCGRNLAIIPSWYDTPSTAPIAAPTTAPTTAPMMVPSVAPMSTPQSAPSPSSTPAKKSAAVTLQVLTTATFVASVLALVC